MAKSWHKDVLAAAGLVVCACLLHGHGLTLGFWFDDHNHLELCQRNGFTDLVNGNRFDWNNGIAHAWWAKKETGWAYFRPLTVAIRTGLFQLFGLDPLPFHILHLFIYSVTVALFYGLLRRCGWSMALSCFAVLFFILHPANCLTTPWLASDCTLLVGLFIVAGFWLFHASAQAGHSRPALLAGVFLCYALAMLSRENGIVLGPLLVLFDVLRRTQFSGSPLASAVTPGATALAGGERLNGVRFAAMIYAALALEGVCFLLVRSWFLGEVPLPRTPYFHWPHEPGFFAWLPFKLLNEFVCLPLGLPLVPIVEVPWWQGHPLTTALAVTLLIVLGIKFFAPLKRSRLAWGIVAGIVIAQAPTMPVFSASYNYYLATAGWALLLATWVKHVWPARPHLVRTATGMLAASYLLGLWAGSWMIHSVATAERLLRSDVLATRPAAYPAGTKLFFINMPFFAMEAGPSLRLAANRPDLEVYPLTLAPQVFFPKSEVLVLQEDERTMLLTSTDVPLFAGKFGDMIQLGWFGAARGDLTKGAVQVPAEAGPMPFRVELVKADSQGITALRLIFDRPLDHPGYRFFIGSHRGLAQEVLFGARAHGSLVPVAVARPVAENSIDDRDFERLRRMEISSSLCLSLLGNWPF